MHVSVWRALSLMGSLSILGGIVAHASFDESGPSAAPQDAGAATSSADAGGALAFSSGADAWASEKPYPAPNRSYMGGTKAGSMFGPSDRWWPRAPRPQRPPTKNGAGKGHAAP